MTPVQPRRRPRRRSSSGSATTCSPAPPATASRWRRRTASVSSAGTPARRPLRRTLPPSQAKFVTCLRGAVLDVVVDLRVGSPTFGQWDAVLLDTETPSGIYVPEGRGHAFIALDDHTVVNYLCSAPFAPAREHGVNAFDPTSRPSTGRRRGVTGSRSTRCCRRRTTRRPGSARRSVTGCCRSTTRCRSSWLHSEIDGLPPRSPCEDACTIDVALPRDEAAPAVTRSFAACVASVTETPITDVPRPQADVAAEIGVCRSWLAGRGAGLVRLARRTSHLQLARLLARHPRTPRTRHRR